jgi:hypothetical protein
MKCVAGARRAMRYTLNGCAIERPSLGRGAGLVFSFLGHGFGAMADEGRVWVVQIDGAVPAGWDLSAEGRKDLQRIASGVGAGLGTTSIELLEDRNAFRFVLVLSGRLRRPDDIARASREALQDAIARLGLVGTSVVWRTFDVLDDGDVADP